MLSDRWPLLAAVRAAPDDDAPRLAFADWCREHGATYLLTAHHADDQAETLLLRLKRGSHVSGLSAMPLIRGMPGLLLLRPLLPVAKARLETTLEARGQRWIEDPSNRNEAYDRAQLRALMLEGANSPIIGEFNQGYFDGLRERIRKRAGG